MPTSESSLLLVPIHLDALLVQGQQALMPPTADFTRLPHVRDGHDVNASVPWIGEAIASQPFVHQPVQLDKGLHLHWALPDALCRAATAENGDSALRYPFRTDGS